MVRDEQTPKDALFEWATSFAEPEPSDATTRVPVTYLAGALGLITILAFLVVGLGRSTADAPSAPADREPAAAPATIETPEPTPMPTEDAASPLPTDCRDLYSEAMRSQLEDAGLRLTLNLTGPARNVGGSSDKTLRHLLAHTPQLDCNWFSHERTTSAVLTVVAEPNATKLAQAQARLEKLPFTRVDESGGVRFVHESVTKDGRPRGESHFFREGLWFATRWYGFGPRGYSADMAAAVFD